MATSTLVLVTLLCYLSVVCEGGVRKVVYNEQDLIGGCSKTCARLPVLTDKYGCDQISNCRLNKLGWSKGFVRCNWCTCDCKTSNDFNKKEIILEGTKIINEDELWNTCRRTCYANGLQKTDNFGCSEIRDCTLHKKGWIRGFVRCNYCECKCVIKGYPKKYRLENLKFDIDLIVTDKADSVVVGKTTAENHSSREQTFTRLISTSIETSRLWEESSSSSLSSGVSVSISDPVLNIASLERTTTLSKTTEYRWGETKTWSINQDTTQQVVVGPQSTMEATMLGTHYTSSVPYTADLIITYDDGRTKRKPVSGVLHEATVSDVHLVYGKSTPLSTKRNDKHDA